jgi:uncharacterized ferritin-like protein (DUF455 family)
MLVAPMPEAPTTLRAFCRRILEAGDLATKLVPPPAALADEAPGPALCVVRPARDPAISLTPRAGRLPRPAALGEPAARAQCLARFAHHELQAVELFAWALLRWPDLDPALRVALAGILADEQRHCALYLDRLEGLGSRLEEHPRSDYFWKHVPAIEASPHGPRAFLCAMGLTLEQANLDFSGLYEDGFRAVGDEASARVCRAVHEDEVRHVRIAATWLGRLSEADASIRDTYESAVPFPLAANRAKGRRFDADARRRAGLSEDFIAYVRNARGGGG